MTKYTRFQWCPVQEKVVPVEQVERKKSANARDLFIQDEMPPTRNPLNPKEIYTSKSKLRAAYRAAGAVEVGDAYDRGYTPTSESGQSQREYVSKFMAQVKDRIRNG